MEKKQYLFCPGPVNVSDAVKKSLPHMDICHRVPDFEEIVLSIQKGLLSIFKANEDYTVLLITGSGTAANETVISSFYSEKDHVLLVNNGEFGCRLEELFQVHDIKTTIMNFEWAETPRVDDIENKLKENPDITALAMVYHETSTGMINPVSEVGKLANQYSKTFFVDAVSAVGGEDINVVRDHIDLCTTSSNKCLASYPGVGIICAKESALENTRENKVKVAYLNLHKINEFAKSVHQTPNTPSVAMFIALEASVRRILAEGLDNQINRYKRCAKVIRSGVEKLGLKKLIDDKNAANTVTSVFLPMNINMKDFVNTLEDKGYTVYSGKRHLKEQNMFQIANMGDLNEDLCENFIKVLSETLDEYTA